MSATFVSGPIGTSVTPSARRPRKSTACSSSGAFCGGGRSGPSSPVSPWTCLATNGSRSNGRFAPAATGTSSRPTNSSTRIAFAVVFSSVWLPATVVMPTSSTSGLASASRIAIASSWPGSQSIRTGSAKDLVDLLRGREGRLGAGPRCRDRTGGAGAAERLVPVAPLEVRDDKARGERVARRRAVDGVHRRRDGASHLASVLQQRGALGSERQGDKLSARSGFVLDPVDDEQVGFDVDRTGRRRIQAKERRAIGRSEDDRIGDLELAQHGALDGPRVQRSVGAGRDDDSRLAA